MVCCYQHCVNYSDGYLVGAGVQRGLKGCFYVIVLVGDYCSALDVMSGADFGVFGVFGVFLAKASGRTERVSFLRRRCGAESEGVSYGEVQALCILKLGYVEESACSGLERGVDGEAPVYAEHEEVEVVT